MCGIAGVLGVRDHGLVMARRLLGGIRHRGPDDQGIEQPLPTATLVHTRLAIIDLTNSGHQPMSDHRREGMTSNWIVFNGEIYNYRHLQQETEAAGWCRRSDCDTEVILASYRMWGEHCVDHFRGMFAFCLVDTTRGVAHLFRDRLGIKPLYFLNLSGGGLAFASEVRALLALGDDIVPRRVNAAALETYFAQGAVYGNDSIVDGIATLPPATHLCIDLSSGREVTHRTYWSLSDSSSPGGYNPKHCVRSDIAIDGLKSAFRESIQQHLVSDAPLGLFLSGGIDSAALLAISSEFTSHLRTITIGFDSSDADESDAARVTANAFGVEHTVISLTDKDMLDQFEPALAAADQPTVDGFNTYFVSQAARRSGLTVALSGLGADELFGGYASFKHAPWAVAMRRHSAFGVCSSVVERFIKNRFAMKVSESFRRPGDLLSMYLLRRELFLPSERRELQRLPAENDSLTGLPVRVLMEIKGQESSLDETNRVSLYEIELYLRNMLLRDADAFSMAAPIEYRVPFLDHAFVEKIFSLPGFTKRPDPRPKPLLIDIAGPRLPRDVWRRPKHGFSFPWQKWFARKGPLFNLASDAASDSKTWQDLGLERCGVARIWNRFASGDPRVSPLQILAFVNLRDFAVRHRLRAA